MNYSKRTDSCKSHPYGHRNYQQATFDFLLYGSNLDNFTSYIKDFYGVQLEHINYPYICIASLIDAPNIGCFGFHPRTGEIFLYIDDPNTHKHRKIIEEILKELDLDWVF